MRESKFQIETIYERSSESWKTICTNISKIEGVSINQSYGDDYDYIRKENKSTANNDFQDHYYAEEYEVLVIDLTQLIKEEWTVQEDIKYNLANTVISLDHGKVYITIKIGSLVLSDELMFLAGLELSEGIGLRVRHKVLYLVLELKALKTETEVLEAMTNFVNVEFRNSIEFYLRMKLNISLYCSKTDVEKTVCDLIAEAYVSKGYQWSDYAETLIKDFFSNTPKEDILKWLYYGTEISFDNDGEKNIIKSLEKINHHILKNGTLKDFERAKK